MLHYLLRIFIGMNVAFYAVSSNTTIFVKKRQDTLRLVGVEFDQ